MREGITLRYAFPDDARSLAHLAALDSAELPAAPLLVAEVEGELRAALSLSDGRAIADPFHPSVGIVALLRERAAQLRAPATTAMRRRLRRIAQRSLPARNQAM